MKKTLLTSLALATIGLGAFAQNVNIPDANFKAYLVGNSSINTNADTEIQVSEANAFTGQISLTSSSGVTDITGIEAFINLTGIQCVGVNLGTVNISQNTSLTLVNFRNANLTSIDLSQNTALQYLYLENNSINAIDVSLNSSLLGFRISNNNLTSLDISQNTNLTFFACDQNDLSILNMKNISTTTLSVSFDATSNPNLTCIEVDDVTAATANWTNVDATASFSLDCNPLGVDEVELTQRISVYPNPVKSQIYINSDVVIESISIIDAFGKIIKSNPISNNTIDVSRLSNGVYLLQVNTDEGLVIKKFVKD